MAAIKTPATTSAAAAAAAETAAAAAHSLSALRIGFAGTPEFAAVALQALLDADCTVPVVLTQPDRPAGRGMQLKASPVKQLAQQHGITVLQPHSLNRRNRRSTEYAQQAQAAETALRAQELDALVVAAYGLILPQWLLGMPRWGCLNIHASLLPRWRGAAPIHRALEAGDSETGVCIMQMDKGLDTGDVLLRCSLPIAAHDTTASLHDKLATLGAQALIQSLQQLAAGTAVAEPQSQQGICYAEKISKSEAEIDWQLPAQTIARRVRAFNPFPVAQTRLNEQKVQKAPKAQGSELVIRIWQAHAVAQCPVGLTPGTVWTADGDGVGVVCGSGGLMITRLQKRGGKVLDAAAFCNGTSLAVGSRLGLSEQP